MVFRTSAHSLAAIATLFFVFHEPARAAVPAAPLAKATPVAKTTPTTPATPSGPQTETMVFFRHAEKPPEDLGQLTGQGLKRALALPTVLVSKFGKPDHIFAPSPNEKVHEMGVNKYYYYVRPWATVEPTAVMCQLPVNLSVGFTHIGQLQRALSDPKLWNSTIFIVWEHWEIYHVAANILKTFGADPSLAVPWPDPDYDSLYVITIVRQNGKVVSARFVHDHEGLNNIRGSQISLKYLDAVK